jgi:hypothetical protein
LPSFSTKSLEYFGLKFSIHDLVRGSLTIIPAYSAPSKEVFVKPTTAKGVIKHSEVEDLLYKPAAIWAFYTAYRMLINRSKKKVDKRLSPSNAAFSGFLMMSI